MENHTQPEQELEKHDELNTEIPKGQSEETTEAPAKEEIDPLKKLQDELAEAKDKYVRLYAEFDNFRRRSAKEKLEMIQSANEQLLKPCYLWPMILNGLKNRIKIVPIKKPKVLC